MSGFDEVPYGKWNILDLELEEKLPLTTGVKLCLREVTSTSGHLQKCAATNVPHFVMMHSPTGFSWGYRGSGCYDLSLNIIEWYLRFIGYKGEVVKGIEGKCFGLTKALAADFVVHFIEPLPTDGGFIQFALLDLWMKSRLKNRPSNTNKAPTKSLNRAGYVYLLKAPNSVYWKIGRTSNPDDRMKTFANKLPLRVEYEHLIPTGNMQLAEKFLHNKFAEKRVDGEWFELCEADIEFIRSLPRL